MADERWEVTEEDEEPEVFPAQLVNQMLDAGRKILDEGSHIGNDTRLMILLTGIERSQDEFNSSGGALGFPEDDQDLEVAMLTELFIHLRAGFRAHGKEVIIAPLGGDG